MKRVEVRCCCSPVTLLGSLPFPENRDVWQYQLMQPRNAEFPLTQRATSVRFERIVLRLASWIHTERDPKTGATRPVDSGIAIKADGIPIETLRRIPGFLEAGTAVGRIPQLKKDSA